MQKDPVPSKRSVTANTWKPSVPLFQSMGSFMVRSPLFPVEAYQQLSTPAAGTIESLLATNPSTRLAIGVGSPSLLDAIDSPSSRPRDVQRRNQKLLRYLIRMSTRPTPYGLFAGVALGQLSQVTNLSITNPMACIQARLDMGWLMSIIWKLEALPAVRRHLCWVANSAVYLRNGRVWLHERASADASQETPGVSLRATAAVTQALTLARQPVAYPDLVDKLLASIPGATLIKVEGLLTELWQQSVLLSDLRPPLTGDLPPEHYLQQRLATIPSTTSLAEQLAIIQEELRAWEAEPRVITVSRYRALLGQMEQFATAGDAFFDTVNGASASSPPFSVQVVQQAPELKHLEKDSPQALLQVDMGLGVEGGILASSVGAEVAHMAEVLLRLTPFPHGPTILTAYRNAFTERYGEERAVPLAELLDPNFGLGALETDRNATVSGLEDYQEAKRNRTLVNLALTAQQKRQMIVELDEKTIKRLETWTPALTTAPASVDLNIFLAATSAEEVDAGRYQLVLGPNVGGREGGRNFGRFASLFGKEGVAILRQLATQVEQLAPDQLMAEVVYLPKQNRMSNVTIRSSVYRYELLYGTAPGVAWEQTIPLNELVVGLRQGRFYLHWPRKNIDVIVHAGHMLNPRSAPPIIRFLTNVSLDGTPLLSSFDWGAAKDFPFLPRIQMGRLVFALAQWRLTTDTRARDLPTISPEAFHAALCTWRECWQIPRFVYLSVADHRLLLDLEHPQQREELRWELHKLQETSALILQEVFPTLDQAWVQGPGGHYVTEFIFPLLRHKASQVKDSQIEADEEVQLERSNAPRAALPMPTPIQRLKALSSEWLFLKLYVGRNLQEDLIAGPLRVFVRDAITAGLAEEWFFLRYRDPNPHLRLRFRGDPKVLTGKLLPMLCEWCTKLMIKGPCLKYNFDTYDREIERYGGVEGVTLAESIFGADSSAVADLLAVINPAGTLDLNRKLLAVLTADDLLTSLGADAPARLAWAQWRVKEQHQSGQAYRQHSRQLRLLISDPAHALADLMGGAAVLSILATRRQTLAPIAAQLIELEAQQALCQPLTALYASYLHMHWNRLLGIDRTTEEEVVGLLLRTYKGLERAPMASSFSKPSA